MVKDILFCNNEIALNYRAAGRKIFVLNKAKIKGINKI